jgi:hypothetical protein
LRFLTLLSKHHGIARVLVEGLAPDGMPAYRKAIAALKWTDEEVTKLILQNVQVRGKDLGADRKVDELYSGQQRELLEYGAAAKLAMHGSVEVLPLEDQKLLEQAKPVRPDGSVKLDTKKVEARHDAQVKGAMESGPVSVLILGGSHDLSASVRKLGGGTTEYLRVTLKKYREISGEK